MSTNSTNKPDFPKREEYVFIGEYVEITDPDGGLPLDSEEACERMRRTEERLQNMKRPDEDDQSESST